LPLQVRQIIELPGGWAGVTSNGPSAPRPLNDNNQTAGGGAETIKPAPTQDDFLARWGANDFGTKADRDAATTWADDPRAAPPPRTNADDTRAPDEPPPHANDNTAPADRAASSAMKEQETAIVRADSNPPARHDAGDDATVQLEPHDATDPSAVAHAKGIAAYRKGDLKLALADFSRAVELNPAFMLAYVNRGIVLYRMGKLDLALADVAHARRIDRANQRTTAAAFHKRRRGVSLLIERPILIFATGQ